MTDNDARESVTVLPFHAPTGNVGISHLVAALAPDASVLAAPKAASWVLRM